MADLTDKQRRFVEEYLIDSNATQACIRAGYSARNADKIGPQLVGKTRVAAAIAEARRQQSERTQVTADYVLNVTREIVELHKGEKPTVALQGAEMLGRWLGMGESPQPPVLPDHSKVVNLVEVAGKYRPEGK